MSKFNINNNKIKIIIILFQIVLRPFIRNAMFFILKKTFLISFFFQLHNHLLIYWEKNTTSNQVDSTVTLPTSYCTSPHTPILR